MFPKKLATKITAMVVMILLILVVTLIGGANWITKTYYQEHVTREIESRAVAHAELLQETADDAAMNYIEEVEAGKHSFFILLDEDLAVQRMPDDISDDFLVIFFEWLNDNQETIGNLDNEPFIDHVETYMITHIPHVWAIIPVNDPYTGTASSYLFLDQDTGELNEARVQLLLLLVVMSIFIILISFFLTRYLTSRVSKPLNDISEMTEKIAEGDLDIKLNIGGEDEVGHLADSIQSMTGQLKTYRDSRRHFISHISHDLRTPITYIKGYSAVMKESTEINQEEWKEHISVIYHEANRMERLVSDLFLLTKLEEGKINLILEEVPADEWLEQIYRRRVLLFDQKSISHELNISEECKGAFLTIDPARMEQALVNILENSIRYTPKGGKITISLSGEKGGCLLSIKDTGQGIDEEDIDHIWERFYKADKSRTQNDSGTGLGLAIVKEITELHGGKVWVKSKPGEGTEFFIWLPDEQDPS
ncbi:HAMP domain-containing histidine kinase [Evansella sp. LMS18]|uniref:sensor histidine kinase n=1 Tax=Evansella sp. LMS18 TaxID=2924033 RepID=UPI0020D11516|nr:HAMP domain-containing sensor histidine kinase [Evansella sp. LMS18]UTR12157.1 HAMP domain-containing histidine kinase [Evansella sp. LMS18]